MKRRCLYALLICLIGAMIQTGCGGATGGGQKASYESYDSSSHEAGIYEEPMVEDELSVGNFSAEATDEVSNEEVDTAAVTNRKLIRTVEMTVETETYDELMKGLESEIKSLGGYIEYKDAYHGDIYSKYEGNRDRNANLIVRIPSTKLDEFTSSVGNIGNVTYESESVEDVTLQYVDLSSHKKMLQAQQDRLLELLEQADTIEDIITLEGRLSEVRYQIESMESRLRTFDNQVEYSTVHLTIEEVERYTPQPEETVMDRIKTGFTENVYSVVTGVINFVVELIIALPILALLAVIGVIISFIFRRIKIRKNKNKEEKSRSFFGSISKRKKDSDKSEGE